LLAAPAEASAQQQLWYYQIRVEGRWNWLSLPRLGASYMVLRVEVAPKFNFRFNRPIRSRIAAIA
jgi:hypothetical protein